LPPTDSSIAAISFSGVQVNLAINGEAPDYAGALGELLTRSLFDGHTLPNERLRALLWFNEALLDFQSLAGYLVLSVAVFVPHASRIACVEGFNLDSVFHCFPREM
jgi:hypothetical protein